MINNTLSQSLANKSFREKWSQLMEIWNVGVGAGLQYDQSGQEVRSEQSREEGGLNHVDSEGRGSHTGTS